MNWLCTQRLITVNTIVYRSLQDNFWRTPTPKKQKQHVTFWLFAATMSVWNELNIKLNLNKG